MAKKPPKPTDRQPSPRHKGKAPEARQPGVKSKPMSEKKDMKENLTDATVAPDICQATLRVLLRAVMSDDKEHRLALDNQPEFAQQIGFILSASAILELSPPHLLAKLMGISHNNADMILGYHRNFKSRVNLLKSLAVLNTQNQESGKIIYLCDTIANCIDIRNKYAHGLWQMEGDGDRNWWRLITWLSDAVTATKTEFVTLKSIKKDCSILRETLHECISYAPIFVPQFQPSEPPK